MTKIRLVCPQCGSVELTPHEVVLLQCGQAVPCDSCTYSFECPACGTTSKKPLVAQARRLLVGAGVPTRFDKHGSQRWSAPLTYDDLLDLMLELKTEDWFDRCL